MKKGTAVPLVALTEEELTRVLTYAGLVLVAFELVKSPIVRPIREFYSNTKFGAGMPFKSFERDVLSRHRNEFEACLMYLRDFMEAIDSEDMGAIQALRTHRNEVAHDLANRLHLLRVDSYASLLTRVDKALFKLSNYRTYIELGTDAELRSKGVDWETVKGHEYLLFEEIRRKVRVLETHAAD